VVIPASLRNIRTSYSDCCPTVGCVVINPKVFAFEGCVLNILVVAGLTNVPVRGAGVLGATGAGVLGAAGTDRSKLGGVKTALDGAAGTGALGAAGAGTLGAAGAGVLGVAGAGVLGVAGAGVLGAATSGLPATTLATFCAKSSYVANAGLSLNVKLVLNSSNVGIVVNGVKPIGILTDSNPCAVALVFKSVIMFVNCFLLVIKEL